MLEQGGISLANVEEEDVEVAVEFTGPASVGDNLQWLLEHHHHLTLVVMTGLLAGSLRALWPWQPWAEERRTLLAPSGDVAVTVGLMALGAAIVVTILVIARRHSASPQDRATVEA
jgi:putative membrane protein